MPEPRFAQPHGAGLLPRVTPNGSQGLLKTNDLVALFRTFFFRIQADRAFCRDVYGAGTAPSRRLKRAQPLRRDRARALAHS